jgi:hypothetical protein
MIRMIRPTSPLSHPVKVLAALLPAVLAAVLAGGLGGCSVTGEKRAAWTPIPPPPGAHTADRHPAPNGLERARAEEVFGRIRQAFDASPSVHASGELVSDGETIRVDVRLEDAGAQGTFVSSSLGRISEIVIGDDLYLAGDPEFLRSVGGDALAARGRGGAWVTGTTARGLATLPLLSKAAYLALLDSGRLYPLGDAFTSGVPTRTFTNDAGLRMLVPLAGEPRLMRTWKEDRTGHLDLHFEYGGGWAVRAPGSAEPV